MNNSYSPPPCTNEFDWMIRMEIDREILGVVYHSFNIPLSLRFNEDVWKEANGYNRWKQTISETRKLYELSDEGGWDDHVYLRYGINESE